MALRRHDSFIICEQTTPALPTQKSLNAGCVCTLGRTGVFCEALSRSNVFEPWIIKSYADMYNSVKYNIADCKIN